MHVYRSHTRIDLGKRANAGKLAGSQRFGQPSRGSTHPRLQLLGKVADLATVRERNVRQEQTDRSFNTPPPQKPQPTCFALAGGTDLSKVQLVLRGAVDNDVTNVQINGTSTGISFTCFGFQVGTARP